VMKFEEQKQLEETLKKRFEVSISRMGDNTISHFLQLEQNALQYLMLPVLHDLGFKADPYSIWLDENVTYVMQGGRPIIKIQTMGFKADIEDVLSQKNELNLLYHYHEKNCFGILTNGADWLFYGSYDKEEYLDETPFYRFNIYEMNDKDYTFLANFCENNLKQAMEEVYEYGKSIRVKQLHHEKNIDVRKVVKDALEQALGLGLSEQHIVEMLKVYGESGFVQLDAPQMKEVENSKATSLGIHASDEVLGKTIHVAPKIEASDSLVVEVSTDSKKSSRRTYLGVKILGKTLAPKPQKSLSGKDIMVFVSERLIELNPDKALELPNLYLREALYKKSKEEFSPGYAKACVQLSNGLHVTTVKTWQNMKKNLDDLLKFFELASDVLEISYDDSIIEDPEADDLI
jgi:hypothetical protein